MKLAIIGGRDFQDFSLADQTFIKLTEYFLRINEPVEIVSGGAKGADLIGKKIANKYSLKYIEFLPDWDLYGKSAGFKRNVDIINDCDQVLAFWDGVSKGTAHSLKLAKQSKKPTTIIYY